MCVFRLAHLCEEASKILFATRSCFSHTSIDYTYQINVLFTQHQVELIELFLSYINYHKAFFHQGYELLSLEAGGDFHSITTQVSRLTTKESFRKKILVDKNQTRECSTTEGFGKSSRYQSETSKFDR